jgi:hypothetical protein
MRKALLMVVALSSILWSGGLAETWMGDPVHLIALLLISGGMLLYGIAFVLFCFRFFQWLRVLKEQKVDLSGFHLFRRIQAIRQYQREAQLQAVLVFLIPLMVCIPLSFFQQNMDNTIVLTMYLVLPLSLLLYAILSKTFDHIAMTALS